MKCDPPGLRTHTPLMHCQRGSNAPRVEETVSGEDDEA